MLSFIALVLCLQVNDCVLLMDSMHAVGHLVFLYDSMTVRLSHYHQNEPGSSILLGFSSTLSRLQGFVSWYALMSIKLGVCLCASF